MGSSSSKSSSGQGDEDFEELDPISKAVSKSGIAQLLREARQETAPGGGASRVPGLPPLHDGGGVAAAPTWSWGGNMCPLQE